MAVQNDLIANVVDRWFTVGAKEFDVAPLRTQTDSSSVTLEILSKSIPIVSNR